jgi:hypothetical protein
LAAAALVALVHCGGQTTGDAQQTTPDASSSGGSSSGGSSSGGSSSGGVPDSGGDDAACLGLSSFDGGPRGTPAQHRATATACSASTVIAGCLAPGTDAGSGGQACSTDADCAPDGSPSTPYAKCLHGACGIDECLTDSDCATGTVCSCSSAYYGGISCYHPNLCVPSNCHVDGDCGSGGFCSPSAGYCGVVEGFYCHKPTDPCFDETTDCACTGQPGFHACVYTPTIGAFVCGGGVCAG